MDQDKRTKLALLIMVVAMAGFFLSFAYFGLFGTKIEYANAAYMMKAACGFGFILFGLFLGAYVYGEKQFAVRVAGGLAALVLIAYLLGLAIHKNGR